MERVSEIERVSESKREREREDFQLYVWSFG